jgi:hypothetical protein
VAVAATRSYPDDVNFRTILLLALALCAGCASRYVVRGADLYASGRYIEAAEVFERTEARLQEASTADRARYGLYRGVTLLALGDTLRAGNWLSYSHEIVSAEPSSLSNEESTMLARAIGLANRPRSVGPVPTEGTAVATGNRTSNPAAAASVGN